MAHCLFATDLHGNEGRYAALFAAIAKERPDGVFLGGDLFPTHLASSVLSMAPGDKAPASFADGVLADGFAKLRKQLGNEYPRVFLILGNDDGRGPEHDLKRYENDGLWEYVHGRRVEFGEHIVYGYCFVPPTPFTFKDWERYDVSRYTPPGSVSPEEGRYSFEVDLRQVRYATIKEDLDELVPLDEDLGRAIFLFHTPPHETNLDRAGLDGRFIDHVPVDVHVGSIAVRRFLEERQPLVSLHGHVHESARLTGSWRDQLGKTWCLGGAHGGSELSLVAFNTDEMVGANRQLI